MVEPLGGDIDDAVCQLECLGMAHLESGGVIELCRLLGDGFDDLGAGMSGIDAPQTRRAIEHLAAVTGGVMHVLGGDEHARGFLELPISGKRHPEGAQVVRHHGI